MSNQRQTQVAAVCQYTRSWWKLAVHHPSCMVRVNLLLSAMTQCLHSPGMYVVTEVTHKSQINMLLHEVRLLRTCFSFDTCFWLWGATDNIVMTKSRRMRWAGHVAWMGAKRNVYRILVGKPEGKRPLGRPRLGWVDIIKLAPRFIGGGVRAWIDLARGGGSCTHGNEPWVP
jgi:hypothetical protein